MVDQACKKKGTNSIPNIKHDIEDLHEQPYIKDVLEVPKTLNMIETSTQLKESKELFS